MQRYKKLKVLIECEQEKHVRNAIAAKADIIMLDNMKQKDLVKMVKLIRSSSTSTYKPLIEISGGVNFKTIKNYAKLGKNINRDDYTFCPVIRYFFRS